MSSAFYGICVCKESVYIARSKVEIYGLTFLFVPPPVNLRYAYCFTDYTQYSLKYLKYRNPRPHISF